MILMNLIKNLTSGARKNELLIYDQLAFQFQLTTTNENY